MQSNSLENIYCITCITKGSVLAVLDVKIYLIVYFLASLDFKTLWEKAFESPRTLKKGCFRFYEMMPDLSFDKISITEKVPLGF